MNKYYKKPCQKIVQRIILEAIAREVQKEVQTLPVLKLKVGLNLWQPKQEIGSELSWGIKPIMLEAISDVLMGITLFDLTYMNKPL
jgi:hypothetical protein